MQAEPTDSGELRPERPWLLVGVVEPGVPADEFTGCLDLQTMTIAYIKDYI